MMSLVLVIGLLIALYALNCANNEIDRLQLALMEQNKELKASNDVALDIRTVSRPDAVLKVTAVPIPPKIQSMMADAIKGEK